MLLDCGSKDSMQAYEDAIRIVSETLGERVTTRDTFSRDKYTGRRADRLIVDDPYGPQPPWDEKKARAWHEARKQWRADVEARGGVVHGDVVVRFSGSRNWTPVGHQSPGVTTGHLLVK